MNSTHDLGGTHGHGSIDQSQKQNFACEWEEKVFSLTLACGMLGKWNLDETRFARESMDPGEYLMSGYYEHWLHGLETLLLAKGLVSDEELANGVARSSAGIDAASPESVGEKLRRGGPTEMETDSSPVYQTGDWVRVRRLNPKSHIRAPRYIHGCRGRIRSHYGAHILPDEHACSGKKVASHLYSIEFAAEELWGPADCEPRSPVFVDVFEPYIEGLANAV